MSFNRDKEKDRATTLAVLEGRHAVDDGVKNWLGHGTTTGAARIDAMLINGATKGQILKRIAPRRNEISAHLSHLRLEHGLDIDESGGVLSFDRNRLRK